MNASQRLPVPVSLRRWVDHVELAAYRTDDDGCPLIHAPNPATTLVWRTTANGSSSLLVVGPRTHATYHDSKEIPVCARFQLAPGAARALLGTPIDEITDRVIPLSDLWGRSGTRLAHELDEFVGQPTAAAEHIASALAERAQSVRPEDNTATDLVRRASVELSPRDDHPRPRVNEVAQNMSVSERHLRAAFTAAVGVPLKQFARLARLRSILPRLHHEPWASLASSAGYYDQSHMIAQFREAMHVTPRAFTAGRLPTVAC
ncbi:helix-turn-helix transcriptional regulator [Allokutzneria oryzae]|uniref:Helix-turn-helix domain-containing protein n=1 Tax=Allokutzneria oryzae TaxID=1378989 RepID=A0ABV5ZXD5_9PSEU